MTSANHQPAQDDIQILRNHWWWRPGWQFGTRYYTWHITGDTLPGLADHIATYQAALATIPTLDPIPRPWLHMTVQGLGYVQDFSEPEHDRIAAQISRRLEELPSFTATFDRPALHTEAVVLHPVDDEPFHAIRRVIRAALADILGSHHVPEGDRFRPHISAAYVNADSPAAPVRQALASTRPPPVHVAVTTVSLIQIHRDQRMYQWQNIHRTHLASPL